MTGGITLLIFQFLVLIFSVMIHEISHGFVAERLGDPTARLAGRLTLNPLKHIDPFGSIILPLILAVPALFGQPTFIIGWAKPVPYNPNNLRDPERGGALVAAAGPLSNIFIAAVFGILIRIMSMFIDIPGGAGISLVILFSVIISLNLVLAVFNLLPVPPLDGSKVINVFLPAPLRLRWIIFWQRAGFLIRSNWMVFLIVFFLSFRFIFGAIFAIIAPIINFLHLIFAGFPSPFI